MLRKKWGNIEWLEFELFAQEKNLVHGIFLRHGGVSEGTFASLSISSSGGDDDSEKAAENRKRVIDALGIKKYAFGKQVHGKEVVYVKEEEVWVRECDGLMTDQPELGLMIAHADCQTALFYDPIHHALTAVHSGWRGNVKNIYRAAVEKMEQVFGTKPQDLLVGVGPSLGPEHAEFKNYKTELPESFWRFQVKPLYFDLWAIAHNQLEECGILPHHIEMAKMCTFASKEDCFSYRRDKVTGNHATIAALL